MSLQSLAGEPRRFRVAAVLGLVLADSLHFSVGIVVNNGILMPGESVFFNACNQLSINDAGLVVFRARGKGVGLGKGTAGINSPLLPALPFLPALPSAVATRGRWCPSPLTRTPAATLRLPRPIAPLWRVSPDGELLGTSGVYSTLDGVLGTAVSPLGALPALERYAVPGTNLRFDPFPGAPSPTGVYFRDGSSQGGNAPLQRIADTPTLIPKR